MYNLIQADTSLIKSEGAIVYLGGSCRGRDWRLDFYHRFEDESLTFITPRREPFVDPESDPSTHANQVLWDRQAIDNADICVFWLGAGLSNQAARVEIGYALGKGKNVLIGAEPKFLGIEHLAAFSGMILSSTIDGLLNRFASVVAKR